MTTFEQIQELCKCETFYTEEEILFFQKEELEFLNETNQMS